MLKKVSLIAFLVLFSSFIFVSPVFAQYYGQYYGWTGNVNVFLGAKFLDNNDWSPWEQQGEFGIETDFRGLTWPISIAIDFMASSRSEDCYDPYYYGTYSCDASTSEFDIGVRKIWEGFAPFKPFIGGGLSYIYADKPVIINGFNYGYDSDTGTGYWFDVGMYWTLSQHFNLGFEVKESSADVTLVGKKIDAGGTHFGLLVGYHW